MSDFSLETPKYNLKNYTEVYEPSEDSFLFLDALESELEYIKNMEPKIIAEIGSGSGIVITALANILKNNCVYFATDINRQACLATSHTAELNNCNIECLNMNLLDYFMDEIFDIILFNPPYVVTESEELSGNSLNRSWAGGKDGREITDLVLGDLNRMLAKNGVCYMVILKENNPLEIETRMSARGYNCSKIMERKIPGEHLFIFKFCK